MPDVLGIGIETRLPVQISHIGIETILPVQITGIGIDTLGAGSLAGLVDTVTATGIAFDGGGPALGTLGAGDQILLGSDGTIGNTPANQGVDITP